MRFSAFSESKGGRVGAFSVWNGKSVGVARVVRGWGAKGLKILGY